VSWASINDDVQSSYFYKAAKRRCPRTRQGTVVHRRPVSRPTVAGTHLGNPAPLSAPLPARPPPVTISAYSGGHTFTERNHSLIKIGCVLPPGGPSGNGGPSLVVVS
jgi:hypothetical protein